MFKKRYVAIVFSLFLLSCGSLLSCGYHGKGIPGKAGNWRVHIGPPGNEFHAPTPEKKKNRDEIMVEVKHLLGQYRTKFNIENRIDKLEKNPGRANGGYRFVVLGDSRSNQDLWSSMVRHIDQLDPRPAFVINTGDIVRHGYTKEYLEYYIPPLMETDIPYFVAIGNHDYGADGDALEYRYLFGENALNYFFDHGITRYVFMDNVTNLKSHMETLEWLDTVLKETPEGFHRIVAAHQPVATIKKWAYHSWDKGYSRLFVELMEKYSVDHVFFGHIHAYSTMTLNGIPYTISGGGGAGLHNRFGPLGNVHHYIICDVMADGSMEQKVVRFYRDDS